MEMELDVLKNLISSSVLEKAKELAFKEYKGPKVTAFFEKEKLSLRFYGVVPCNLESFKEYDFFQNDGVTSVYLSLKNQSHTEWCKGATIGLPILKHSYDSLYQTLLVPDVKEWEDKIEHLVKKVFKAWERIEHLTKQAKEAWEKDGRPMGDFVNKNPLTSWFNGHCSGRHIGRETDYYYLYTSKGWHKCPNLFNLQSVK